MTLKYHPPLSRLSHSNHHLLFKLLYLQKRMNYFKALFHDLICMCNFSAMQCCSMPMLSCFMFYAPIWSYCEIVWDKAMNIIAFLIASVCGLWPPRENNWMLNTSMFFKNWIKSEIDDGWVSLGITRRPVETWGCWEPRAGQILASHERQSSMRAGQEESK